MKSRSHLNTRLLPLSILISSLVSGAALAAPSDQDLTNQAKFYTDTGVITAAQAEALIKRLAAEKLKQEEAQVKQEQAASEKAQKEASAEITSIKTNKILLNSGININQKTKLAAEKVFSEANKTQDLKIKAVNKNWSLSTENLSANLATIINGESSAQAFLEEKTKLAKIADTQLKAQAEKVKLLDLDTKIQQVESDLADAKNNETTGTDALEENVKQAEAKLEAAESNPNSKLSEAKAAHERTKDNISGDGTFKDLAAKRNQKEYEAALKKLQDPIDAATQQLNNATQHISTLKNEQSALATQKVDSVALTHSLQEELKQAKNAQLQAEQAVKKATDAKSAQQAMAEAAGAENALEAADQKLAAIKALAQKAEEDFDAAVLAQKDAEQQLIDKIKQLETINQSLTALGDLDPNVNAQQTIAKGEERFVDKNALAMATHVAGGKQKVTGGMVLASLVTEGGEVNLSDNALAHDTQLIEGTLSNRGAHDVNTQVGAQGTLLINGTEQAAATSEGAMVDAGGSVIVGKNALVSNMVTAGTIIGNDGALFTDTTLTGGQFDVNEGAIANGVTLTGGKFNLKARAQAMKLIVENGDAQIAGNLNGVTLNGGDTTFTDSAEVTGAIDSQNGSVLNIHQGANTTQADLNLAGRAEFFADDVTQAAALLPSRAVRSAGNMPMEFILRNVDMNGGTLSLSHAKNAQVQMDSLAGSGTFLLGSALQQDAFAPVNVIGNAEGNFIIQIDGSGIDPTNINVINTGGGDARFTLTDGPVGLGNRMYNLVKDTNGKITLAVDKSTLTPSAASILAVANTTPVIFNAELSAVQQRLDKQSTEANESGMWGSYLHNNFAVKGRNANFDQTLNGMTLGGDKATALKSGVLSVGGFASYSSSDIKTDYQSKGKVDSHSFGAYTQYLDNSGYYVNGVVKNNKFNQDIYVTSANNSASGNSNFSGMGAAVKAGKHINHENVYVSPYVAMSAFSSGKSAVKLSNGMQAQSSSTRSMIGSIGVNAGYRVVLENGVEMKPYVSASVDHEFAASNKVRVNQEMFDNNLNGTRINGGAGLNVNITPNLSMGSEVKVSSGKNIKTPVTFNLNVGYRF